MDFSARPRADYQTEIDWFQKPDKLFLIWRKNQCLDVAFAIIEYLFFFLS